MLKTTDNAIKKYILNVEALKNAYNEEKNAINKTYVKDSEMWNRYTQELEEKHKSTLDGLKATARRTAEKDIKEAKDRLNEYISAPVPIGFADTFKTLEGTLNTITTEELLVFAERYKDNYLANRSMTALINKKALEEGKSELLPKELIELEEVKAELKAYEGKITELIDNYQGERTYTANCIMLGDEPGAKLNTLLNDFIKDDIAS